MWHNRALLQKTRMKRAAFAFIALIVFVCFILGFPVLAAGEAAASGESHGLSPAVLIGVAIMLVLAKLAGEIFERLHQPGVLGELCAGIVLGNLVILGFTRTETLKTNETIAALAELGVIILLFEVGLESDLGEMLEVGWSSLLVAVLGVIAPFFLGWGVSVYFMPHEPRLVHIFIGAILCATSVGITARVFKDLGKLGTREARIILGAAVLDDVLGLLVLAVVVGAIKATATGAALSVFDVIVIALKSVVFLGRINSNWTVDNAAHASWRGSFGDARRLAHIRDFVLPDPCLGGGQGRTSADRRSVCSGIDSG
jgi:Kef-type K+ transport system membrane component KefB